MYDIKSIEAGNTTNQQKTFVTSTFYENLNSNYKQRANANNTINNTNNRNTNSSNRSSDSNCNSISSQIPENNTMFLTFRRRRIFNRQTCLISIMAAFIFGLSLGVFLPMVSMTASAFTTELVPSVQQDANSAGGTNSQPYHSNKLRIQSYNSDVHSNNNNNNNINNNTSDSGNSSDKYNNVIANHYDNNAAANHLKIATATLGVETILSNVPLQANKTSLNKIDDSENNRNGRQYNTYIPKHPESDFPTIYELKQQQLLEQQQLQMVQAKRNSNNRIGDTQQFSLNHDYTPQPTAPSSHSSNRDNNAAASDAGLATNSNGFSVTFVKEKKLPVEEIFRNAFHLEQDKSSIDSMIVKKLNDANDGSIEEFIQQHEQQQQKHTKNGKNYRKGQQYHTSSSTSSMVKENLSNKKVDIDANNDNIDVGNSAAKFNSSDNKKASSSNRNDYDSDDRIKLDHFQSNKSEESDASVNTVTVKFKHSNKMNSQSANDDVDQNNRNNERDQYERHNFIKNDIFWGDLVENAIPKGYNHDEIENWNYYVQNVGVVKTLENGCGRMQNRLVIFNDGKRACARYRQNTDQIQGELFSFYLGQLLNLTNLAPSTASVIDYKYDTWSFAQQDLQNAQWKQTRPVVLTKWLPDLEPAGIPIPFQPLERHLNKYDVWNITLSSMMESQKMLINQKEQQQQRLQFEQENEKQIKDIQNQQQQQQQHDRKLQQDKNKYHDDLNNKILNKYQYTQPQDADQSQQNAQKDKKGLLERLVAKRFNSNNQSSGKSADSISLDLGNREFQNADVESLINHSGNTMSNNEKINYGDSKNQKTGNHTIVKRLIELAQWSDLIVFDYLIANLDRVVNNLYNFQWNADIMAAPAHNLARQIDSELLIFLDNESGLLHGYRLLKKYEAYHSLLLDNLCVFREPTINALKRIKEIGAGQLLQDIFEQSTSHQLRDVLPSLPDKSIKILTDRIDRVLGQVQKCQNLFSDR